MQRTPDRQSGSNQPHRPSRRHRAVVVGLAAFLGTTPVAPTEVGFAAPPDRTSVAVAARSAAAPAPASTAPTASSTRPPAVARWRLTDAQRRHIAWAYERFRASGLEPPSAAIIFTPESVRCGGSPGRFRTSRNLVQICARDDIGEPSLRWLLLHELAHAWEHANLNDAERDRFQRHRGVPTWGSADFPWTDRATEHAAEVITWGLFDQPLVVQCGGDNSAGALREAFTLLTGTYPINNGAHPASDPTDAPAVATITAT